MGAGAGVAERAVQVAALAMQLLVRVPAVPEPDPAMRAGSSAIEAAGRDRIRRVAHRKAHRKVHETIAPSVRDPRRRATASTTSWLIWTRRTTRAGPMRRTEVRTRVGIAAGNRVVEAGAEAADQAVAEVGADVEGGAAEVAAADKAGVGAGAGAVEAAGLVRNRRAESNRSTMRLGRAQGRGNSPEGVRTSL